MLSEHMPELVPTYEVLCELAGGGDLEARMLSMWRPPSYLSGCSQAVWTRGKPVLVRNYDYSPDRIEGAILSTGWGSCRVIGMSDCLWGLLDGVNEAGLAVSLAFGGRRVVGRGFGVPLVVRYLLQVCATVAEAQSVLGRLPHHLAHTLTLVDRTGDFVTAYLSPDRGALFRRVPLATNHQDAVEWHEHARSTRSVEREAAIGSALERAHDCESLVEAFLAAPLNSAAYRSGMGTLYTAVYRPARGSAEYRWPDFGWEHSFGSFHEGSRTIRLLESSAA
jgi:predicted choloylglycine hydrolase